MGAWIHLARLHTPSPPTPPVVAPAPPPSPRSASATSCACPRNWAAPATAPTPKPSSPWATAPASRAPWAWPPRNSVSTPRTPSCAPPSASAPRATPSPSPPTFRSSSPASSSTAPRPSSTAPTRSGRGRQAPCCGCRAHGFAPRVHRALASGSLLRVPRARLRPLGSPRAGVRRPASTPQAPGLGRGDHPRGSSRAPSASTTGPRPRPPSESPDGSP